MLSLMPLLEFSGRQTLWRSFQFALVPAFEAVPLRPLGRFDSRAFGFIAAQFVERGRRWPGSNRGWRLRTPGAYNGSRLWGWTKDTKLVTDSCPGAG